MNCEKGFMLSGDKPCTEDTDERFAPAEPGLGSLPLLSSAETRSISAENPNGERGGGAKAEPDEQNAASMLGKGWKVRPCITLEPRTTTTLADIQGPGIIQHIWITVDVKAYRDTILRIFTGMTKARRR